MLHVSLGKGALDMVMSIECSASHCTENFDLVVGIKFISYNSSNIVVYVMYSFVHDLDLVKHQL
jgi:hypothetical protein